MQTKIELYSDGGDFESKKFKRNYDGVYCVYVFGESLESGGQFCFGAFGSNLASVAVEMFSHLIYNFKDIL
jgi:hypothetical protein